MPRVHEKPAFISQDMVSKELHIGDIKIKQLVSEGKLHPFPGPRGMILYAMEEVEPLRGQVFPRQYPTGTGRTENYKQLEQLNENMLLILEHLKYFRELLEDIYCKKES